MYVCAATAHRVGPVVDCHAHKLRQLCSSQNNNGMFFILQITGSYHELIWVQTGPAQDDEPAMQMTKVN